MLYFYEGSTLLLSHSFFSDYSTPYRFILIFFFLTGTAFRSFFYKLTSNSSQAWFQISLTPFGYYLSHFYDDLNDMASVFFYTCYFQNFWYQWRILVLHYFNVCVTIIYFLKCSIFFLLRLQINLST